LDESLSEDAFLSELPLPHPVSMEQAMIVAKPAASNRFIFLIIMNPPF